MAGSSFWSDSRVEPKRQYRWLINVNGMPEFAAKKVSKPKAVVSETEHKFLNHTFYYPGRVNWETVSLVLADPQEPDVASVLWDMLHGSGYKDPTTYSNSVSTISKARATGPNGLGNITIKQLGSKASSAANTDEIEQWTLKNAWIKDMAWGELDYSSDDMVDCTVTIRYDYALLAAVN